MQASEPTPPGYPLDLQGSSRPPDPRPSSVACFCQRISESSIACCEDLPCPAGQEGRVGFWVGHSPVYYLLNIPRERYQTEEHHTSFAGLRVRQARRRRRRDLHGMRSAHGKLSPTDQSLAEARKSGPVAIETSPLAPLRSSDGVLPGPPCRDRKTQCAHRFWSFTPREGVLGERVALPSFRCARPSLGHGRPYDR